MSFNTAWLHGPAIRHVRFENDNDGVLSERGGIHVHGFVISNATVSDTRILIREFNGAVVFDIPVKAGRTYSHEVPFFVDNGLQVDANADPDVSVTFFFCGEPFTR